MKIAIVGAGIIGVTTAWELASDGHEVTVFERRGAAAEESSFANAGVVAPGYVTPWAAPGMRLKVLRSLLSTHGAIKVRWPLAVRDLRWMAHWQRACRLETYLANRARMQRLAFYSRTRLHEISEARELSYERSDGYLVLLRSKRERKLVQPGLEVLRTAGSVFREIDADEARRIEPALSTDTELAGAIHLPEDEVANCRQFALLLKREAEALGAQFHFNCDIAPLSRAAPRSLALAAGSDAVTYDAIVVCAGVASAALLRPLGIRMPLAPVYGHSVTAHIREPLNAPRSAVMDERYKVAISRMGLRVRVAGSAEIGGALDTMNPAALQTLYKVLHDWFPGAATLQTGVQQWKGARPMLPDGPPVIGPSGVPGVWLNLGHGSSGWALSCGSARVLADLVVGQDAGIDLEGLGIERLL
ncbi:D-amino acid dehydrogenase [Variovorax arabinosiphilus]|uniref:D-amino acid dehydrogenase n=1 Tax=Variovorax arabinosiphilus TaxID=3053498 RepID=UPI0025786EE2|nr:MULTISPECIES: D-amino acid dehydrogenase [unclassified Variovorax]MDM0119152.1 D-amino acid dehydrogenase [Variovorax sp. J2L1-78]MDM0129578.1 D-amino acid dehydrogenase [Variovorax sp. J2L1-63]MDM0232636.1 D-amino acid dehydrogenase [Variovorax sp. J2R1-6]